MIINKFIDTLKNLLTKEFSPVRCVICDNFLSEMIFMNSSFCEDCQNDLGSRKELEIFEGENTGNILQMANDKEKALKLSSMIEKAIFKGLNRSAASLYSTFIVRNTKPSEIDILISHPYEPERSLTPEPDFREKIAKTVGKNLGIIVHTDLFKMTRNGWEVNRPEVIKNKRILMVEVILDITFSKKCIEMLSRCGVAKLEVVALLVR